MNGSLQSDPVESTFECVARKAGGCLQDQGPGFSPLMLFSYYTIPKEIHGAQSIPKEKMIAQGSSSSPGHTPQDEPQPGCFFSFEVDLGASTAAGQGAERCPREARGRWVHVNIVLLNSQQENLSSWIPENIKKKECVYFVESAKLSDAG